MKLLIIILLFSLAISCAKPECDIFFTDLPGAIAEGEDCHSIASCGDGGIDKSLLKLCLSEKEKQKQKQKK